MVSFWRRNSVWLSALLAMGFCLYVVGRQNFLLYHALAEMFCVAVAWGVFLLVWSARRYLQNDALVLLGTVFLFVGCVDLLHALTYKGMGVFPGADIPNLPTQLWVAGRGLEAVGLLAFALAVGRHFPAWRFFWLFAGLTALLLASILSWKVFPVCYVEGYGLTAFKKACEYVICAALLVTGAVLWRKRAAMDGCVYRCMVAAVVLSILSELSFTLYVGVDDIYNRIGHFLKVLSYFMIYRALIHAGLTQPYAVLYGDLARKERDLDATARQYRTTLDSLPDVVVVQDLDQRILWANDKACRLAGRPRTQMVGLRCFDIWCDATEEPCADCPVVVTRDTGRRASITREAPDGRTFQIRSCPIRDESGEMTQILEVLEDITERSRAEKALRASEAKFAKVFRKAPFLMTISAADTGQFIDVNEAFVRITGYSREHALSTTSIGLGFISPQERQRIVDGLAHDGHVAELELEHRRADGARMVCLYSGEFIEVDGRQRLLSIASDMTVRRRREEIQAAQLRLVESAATQRTTQDVLRSVLDEAEALTRSEVGFCHFVAPDQETLSLQAWSTRTLASMCEAKGAGLHYPISEAGVWVDCVHRREPVIHNDYASLPHRKGLPEGHVTVIRELAVPVLRGESVVAILGVGNKKTDYDMSDVETMMQLSDLAWETVVRVHAEEALRRSEERYREFVEQATEGVYMMVLDVPVDTRLPVEEQVTAIRQGARLMECNNAFAGLLESTSAEALRGLGLDELYGPANDTLITDAVKGFIENGYRRDNVIELVLGADGSPRWFRAMSVGFIEDGHLVRISGTQTDVTAQRLAENERERLLAAIDQAAEAVMVTDTRGAILYVNPAFECSTGYSAAEAAGQNPRILKSGQQDAAFYEELWHTISAGVTWQGRFVNRRKDGTLYTEDATISPVRDGAGHIVSYVGVKRDITQELQLEEHLRQAQKMEAIGTLAGGIAHDFNNILAAVSGYAELLQEDLADAAPSLKNHVEQILCGTDRASQLVGQILAFSRKADIEWRPLHLAALVRETAKMLRGAIPSTVGIEVLVSEGSDTVTGDATQLHQVIMNLCTNAWQAMAETGGRLVLSVAPLDVEEGCPPPTPDLTVGVYVRLAVSDTGCGIAEENLPRVFEPFFTTKRQGGGTGMGLSVVHGVIRSHGGAITVESAPGEGTTFTVFLPCAVEPSGVADEAVEPVPRGFERVLVVDDEPAILTVISQMLASLGYDVTTRLGGEAGVSAFLEAPGNYDLVITDLSMPDVTGLHLAERIRAVRPDIRLALCTGFGDEASISRAMDMGFQEVLMKPMRRHHLGKAVRRALDAPVRARGHF